MLSNTYVEPVKTISEGVFWLPLGSKNWAFEAQIVHISENISNEHIKQDWLSIQRKIFNKIVANLNLEAQIGPKI